MEQMNTASSKIKPMTLSILLRVSLALTVGSLVACSTPLQDNPATGLPADTANGDTGMQSPAIKRAQSRWRSVHWTELPGWGQDNLHEAWNAWLKSCERPPAPLAALCADVRRLSIAGLPEKWHWIQAHFQPYRVETHDGRTQGMLTAYYEPALQARRLPDAQYRIPLYKLPLGHGSRKPWYTREQIETLPEAQTALQGREIAWLNDPVDALVLHIQGSGRLQLTEADGSQRHIRAAFAGTNDQPYRSVGKWLLDRGLVRDATWPGISAWLAENPQRTQELLWSNPRYVFFKEEPLQGLDAQFGPRGAQGVPLTPGRSIAVDRGSIPYGTPVWLTTSGPTVQLNRLVMAQDTGSAIVGAVRADYFMGWGKEAGDLAGRVKQDLRLWVLWPKGVKVPH